MTAWLASAGIGYRHFGGLGGRRPPIPGSVNGGWHERGFQGYADYMNSEEFKRALSNLETVASKSPTAIMCAEALWWRCHRRLIADALVVGGWRVEHLGIDGGPVVHSLTEFAVVGPDGVLTYPPAQTTLLERDEG